MTTDTARCIAPHSDSRGEHPAIVGMLCQPAYDRLEQQIAELPALLGWLHANLPTPQSAGLDPDRVSSSHDDPLPLREAVADHATAIVDTLNSWCRLVAEERDLRGPWRPLPADGWPERDRLRRAVEQTASPENLTSFLLAQLSWAAGQPWVDDLITEIADAVRDAHQLAPSRPRLYRLPAPCPSCDALELHRRDGDAYISCGSCGRLWQEDEYRRLCVVLAEEHRRSVPLPEWALPEEVADRYDINPRTVRTWATRGLVASQRRHDGRLLVRTADVEERKTA